MMKSMGLKIAASGFVLGATMIGCQMDGGIGRVAIASAVQDEIGRDAQERATRLHREAGEALAAGNLGGAREAMEQAVALSPRDAGYRLMLADIYMRSGRFRSAETTYRDVIALDPSQSRAGITLALMTAANGRSQEALAQLETLEGRAAAADLGLAYALAGAPQRAIDILEPAAREMGATARVRQNLALSYALAGNWQQARTIAAQDISPSDLGERMQQWASLAQSRQPATQIAAMIGAEPVQDSGQPVQLALAGPAPVAFAEADPMPAAGAPIDITQIDAEVQEQPIAAPAPAPAPVDYAQLEQPDWGLSGEGVVELPEPAPEAQEAPAPVRYAAATDVLAPPAPRAGAVERPVVRRSALVERFDDPAPAPAAGGAVDSPRRSGGRYVVQIGAFSSAGNAERAWQQAETRFGLTERQPVTMTFDHSGRLLHRVAISGFDDRADAARLCATLRARGGECFVRANAGDAVIRWAARYSSRA